MSPQVIATTDDGLMLTVAIDNAATMTPESFNANPRRLRAPAPHSPRCIGAGRSSISVSSCSR